VAGIEDEQIVILAQHLVELVQGTQQGDVISVIHQLDREIVVRRQDLCQASPVGNRGFQGTEIHVVPVADDEGEEAPVIPTADLNPRRVARHRWCGEGRWLEGAFGARSGTRRIACGGLRFRRRGPAGRRSPLAPRFRRHGPRPLQGIAGNGRLLLRVPRPLLRAGRLFGLGQERALGFRAQHQFVILDAPGPAVPVESNEGIWGTPRPVS
jgi:hypothetical protein